MSEESKHVKLVVAAKARDYLRSVLWNLLKDLDTLRESHDVPSPDTITNKIDMLTDEVINGSSGLTSSEFLNKHFQYWTADYNARGWLDLDNEERTCMSACGINSYCWVSAVAGCLEAYIHACAELEEKLYDRNNGKPRNYGPVRSRRFEKRFPRNPGRPPVHPPIGQAPPQKRPKPGRPQKETTHKNGNQQSVKPSSREPSGFPVGRPKGKKDSRNCQRQKDKRARNRIKRGDFSHPGAGGNLK